MPNEMRSWWNWFVAPAQAATRWQGVKSPRGMLFVATPPRQMRRFSRLLAAVALLASSAGCGGDPTEATSPDGAWFCGGATHGLCHEWQGLSAPNDEVRTFCRTLQVLPGHCSSHESLGACVSPSTRGVTRYWWWYRNDSVLDWPSTSEEARAVCGPRDAFLAAP